MVRRHVVALALFFTACLAGCAPTCPDGWEGIEYDCQPSAMTIEDAEQALGTGLYGYVVECEDTDDEDSYSCSPTGFQQGGTLAVHRVEPFANGRGRVDVDVADDGTFRIQLPPGVYDIPAFMVTAPLEEEPDVYDIELDVGDTVMLRVVVDPRHG